MSGAEAGQVKYNFDRVVRLVISTVVVVALFLLVRFLGDVLLPFAAAVLMAYLLNPVVRVLDLRIRRRAVSVLLTVSGVFVVGLALLAVMVPVLHAELTGVAEIVGELGNASLVPEGLKGPDQTWRQAYQSFYEQQAQWSRDLLDEARVALGEADLGSMALTAARRLAPGVWGVVTGVVSLLLGLMGLVVVVLYVVFLLMDYPAYRSQWRELLPPAYRELIVEFFDEFAAAMSRYFRGQALIAIIVGMLFTIGFWLIGLRMAVVLGLFVGGLNMVPYLQTVGLVPALLLAVVRAIDPEQSGGMVVSALLVLMVFGVVQLIQDGLLTPKIMGKRTGLKPVMILLGVFIWGKLLGFLGVLLAIPLTCLGLAYYRRFVLGGSEKLEVRSEK
ncbi:MAG: AI-2E family transporter [Phycisphaerae bacterium]